MVIPNKPKNAAKRASNGYSRQVIHIDRFSEKNFFRRHGSADRTEARRPTMNASFAARTGTISNRPPETD
jgi:hypothetical protein